MIIIIIFSVGHQEATECQDPLKEVWNEKSS